MIGLQIHTYKKLWPLNRSLSGEGVRETFDYILEYLPNLKVKSYLSIQSI